MKLTASDLYGYHRPSKCGLRLYLRQQGVEEAEAGPYDKVLERLGQRQAAPPDYCRCLGR